jgi:ParB family chromosome partitioning protein
MTTPQIELIYWGLIKESTLNPRKTFDIDAIKELAESIAKQGLLQPITVRPFPEMKIEIPKEMKGKLCYQIVCGARRYRAAQYAGLDEIPCIVREMTDEEAFDAMITENLQRKDVEPMDEARAFYELHKRGTSFEELAARFGKSISFIRHRIKLNDLVPELAELLEKKELQISHAQELCKLTVEHQTTLFNDKYSESAQSYYKWNDKSIKDIKNYIESDFRRLDKEIFDKSDCENCEFRCGANALFAEYSENKCTNPDCFDEKVKQHYLILIDEKVSEGYLLVKQDNIHTSMQIVCKNLEESGLSIIERNYKNSDWEHIVEMPERDEDDTDEEWDEAMQDYNNDLAEQNERLENGYQKAVQIEYSGVGIILVKFKENSSSETPEEVIINNQLKELQSKDKRNAEIKIEKIIEDERKLMSESDYITYTFPTTDITETAMMACMLHYADYNTRNEIRDGFNEELSYFENVKLSNFQIKNKIIRSFIQRTITGGDVTYSKDVQSILQAISKEAYPDEAIKIELKHEDAYLKKKENIDKQIKELSK